MQASNEWLKILVSTLAGLLAGLVAEPFKSTVQRKIEVVRLKRAIGFDFLRVTLMLAVTEHELADPKAMWQGVDLPAYQHYWASKRELFYHDFELQKTQTQCQLLLLIKDAVQEGRTPSETGMAQVRKLTKAVIEVEPSRGGKNKIRRWLRGRFLRLIR
jgi:hypothetical protein